MAKYSAGWYIGGAIWRLTRRKSKAGDLLNRAAKIYNKAFEDRGDNPIFNGEHKLLRLAADLKLSRYFDVGANIGEWTAAALQFNSQAEIHAFELSPATADLLSLRYQTEPRVRINAFGLSSENAEVTFHDYEDSKQNTLISGKPPATGAVKSVSSRVVRGDDYCREHTIDSIDLLKVDAEGADHLVLNGFSGLFTKGAVRLVQFEYGYSATTTRYLLRDFVEFFDSFGYQVAKLRSTGIQPDHYDWTWNNFESGPNYVAFKKDDYELIAIAGLRRSATDPPLIHT